MVRWLLFGMILGNQVSAAAKDEACAEALRTARQTVTANLGYDPRVEFEPAPPLDQIRGSARTQIKLYHPRFSTQIAFLDFTLYDHGTSLRVEKVQVLNYNNKRKGLSYLLYAYLIDRHPGVRRVVTYLAEDNLDEYKKQFAKLKDSIAAFKLTPEGKALARMGFTEVRDGSEPSAEAYAFVLTRPTH
jgi:hypothetical protein